MSDKAPQPVDQSSRRDTWKFLLKVLIGPAIVAVIAGYFSLKEPGENMSVVNNHYTTITGPEVKESVVPPGPGGKMPTDKSSEPVPIVYDVGLSVHHNGIPYHALTNSLSAWLTQGKAARVQSISVPSSSVATLFDGDVAGVKDQRAVQQGRYLCVLRITSQSGASAVAGGLTRVDCIYDLVVIDPRTGLTAFSMHKQVSVSDVSAADAQQRADEKFMEQLHTETVTL